MEGEDEIVDRNTETDRHLHLMRELTIVGRREAADVTICFQLVQRKQNKYIET